jgi:hypothetical protein
MGLGEWLWQQVRSVHDSLHAEQAEETAVIGFQLPQDPDPDDADEDAPESSRRGDRWGGRVRVAGRGPKREGGAARGL